MTTEEIKRELTTAFMANADAANLFGFAQGASFNDRFSRVGLMSILFYVVAYVIALKERCLDAWKADIAATASTHGKPTLRPLPTAPATALGTGG